MKVVNFSEQPSVMLYFLNELRDKTIQTDPLRFRRNIERIGETMAYEISKSLPYKDLEIETPLAKMTTKTIACPLVLTTILRAGMPLHTGFLNFFDRAENAFVSTYRQYEDEAHTIISIHSEYMASPDLNGKTLILCDPMLATGGSMHASYEALLKNGKPEKVIIASVIATPNAIAYLEKTMPENTVLYSAAVDPILNEHQYIVPGLGDAGDLCYGEKL